MSKSKNATLIEAMFWYMRNTNELEFTVMFGQNGKSLYNLYLMYCKKARNTMFSGTELFFQCLTEAEQEILTESALSRIKLLSCGYFKNQITL